MELTEKIVKSGWTKYDVTKFCKDEWGLSSTQSERYYLAACKVLIPEDAEKWRELMVSRNFATLEELLKMAMERNDVKSAVEVIKTMNSFLGIGGKAVKIDETNAAGQERQIVISFND